MSGENARAGRTLTRVPLQEAEEEAEDADEEDDGPPDLEDVEEKEGERTNALHAAAGGGHVNVVILLLAAGADVSAVFALHLWGDVLGNSQKFTALDAAASSGQEAVVRVVLEAMQDREVRHARLGITF